MELKVSDVTAVTDRITQLTLVDAAGGALPAYTAGAHLDFDLGEVGTRSYSLVDFAEIAATPASYVIAVQAEPDGDGGSLAMHALGVGDSVTTSAPKNSFELHEGDTPAILIAGGIGVTPLISFATALTARGTPFHFHYAARSRDVAGYADALTQSFADTMTLHADDTNPIDVTALLQNAGGTYVYCCGPKGMIEAVKTAGEAAGIPSDRLRFEIFETPSTQDGDHPFEVQINDGQVFTIPAGQTIIEVLEDAGVDVMYDCQRGDCGICQCDVLDGVPDHRDVVLSADERAAGKVMQICVSRASSPRLVLDI